jgi:hypothetical protein
MCEAYNIRFGCPLRYTTASERGAAKDFVVCSLEN